MNRDVKKVEFGPGYYKLEFLIVKMTEALMNKGWDITKIGCRKT